MIIKPTESILHPKSKAEERKEMIDNLYRSGQVSIMELIDKLYAHDVALLNKKDAKVLTHFVSRINQIYKVSLTAEAEKARKGNQVIIP